MTQMHNAQIPPEMAAHVARRRGGRLHAYDAIDPARTALVVIDMQNLWCQEGQIAYSPYCAGIGDNINRLAASARAAGSKVWWVKAIYQDAPTTWSSYMGYHSPEDVAAMTGALSEGRDEAEIWGAMDVAPDDEIVIKRRFSAMVRGSSDLEDRLRSAGIDMLVVTGVATDVCVESTVRDAFMLDFRNIVVSDATATRSDDAQNASLGAMFNHFADVYATDEVAGLFAAAGTGAVAAE
ncbi:MAG: cysteine hydrolase [Alphaproteobacteria bacterium]